MHFFLSTKSTDAFCTKTKSKHLASEIMAPPNEVQKQSAHVKWWLGSTLTHYTKAKYHCGLWPFGCLQRFDWWTFPRGQCSTAVCLCTSRQNGKNNILYSLCIMILFLVFITILGEWVECLLVISLHMYFLYVLEWVSMIFVISLLVSYTFFPCPLICGAMIWLCH